MGNRNVRQNKVPGLSDPLYQYGTAYGPTGSSELGGYGGRYGGGTAGPYARTGADRFQPATFTTEGSAFGVPWETTDWETVYVPTENPGGQRVRRPVIYIAAPLPVVNTYSGFSGGMPYGGGFGGSAPFTGGFGGSAPFTGGLGGSAPFTGGFGGSAPFTGGLGGSAPFTGGFGGSAPFTGGFGGSAPFTGGFGSSAPFTGGFGSSAPFTGGFGGGLPYGGGAAGANLGYQALPMMTVAYGGGIPGVGGVNSLGGLGGVVPLF